MKNIIIIDDLPSAKKMYKKIFRGKANIGFLVEAEFKNIEKKLKEVSPDLIVLDLAFGVNKDEGLRLLKKLKKDNDLKKIPVIVCSKYIGSVMGMGLKEDLKSKKAAMKFGAIEAYPKYPEPKAEDFLNILENP